MPRRARNAPGGLVYYWLNRNLRELLEEAWRRSAPKRLVATYDGA